MQACSIWQPAHARNAAGTWQWMLNSLMINVEISKQVACRLLVRPLSLTLQRQTSRLATTHAHRHHTNTHTHTHTEHTHTEHTHNTAETDDVDTLMLTDTKAKTGIHSAKSPGARQGNHSAKSQAWCVAVSQISFATNLLSLLVTAVSCIRSASMVASASALRPMTSPRSSASAAL